MPEQFAEAELDGVISAEDFTKINAGLIPQSAKDKWFIYFEEDNLYFHRAQSGSCIFQLEIHPRDDHFVCPRVLVNRDKAQYRNTDLEYDVRLMAWLIDTQLLGRRTPFPQPNRINRQHREAHEKHVTGGIEKNNGGGFINLQDLL